MYQNDRAPEQWSSPISRVDILGGRITELCVYTCGHETQPPEERVVSTDNVQSM